MKVAEKEDYAVSVRYATSSENTGMKLYVDGKVALDNVAFPQGADWETYSTVDAGKVSLSAGEHVLKLEIVGNYVNIDWLNFESEKTIAIGKPALHAVPHEASYDVFDMQGRLVAKLKAFGSESLRSKISATVKRPGTYIAKPQTGGKMLRISVK